MLNDKETVELRDLLLNNRNPKGVEIRVGSPYNILMINDDVECTAARNTLSIGPNGNLYPCDAFKNIEPSHLDVKDEYNNIHYHALQQCWYNSYYLNAVRRYLSAPFGPPCAECRYLEWCKSGCLAQKVIEQESILNGNIMKMPDPLCLASLIGEINASC